MTMNIATTSIISSIVAIILCLCPTSAVNANTGTMASHCCKQTSQRSGQDEPMTVTPHDYGWEGAKTGEERFQVLYRMHEDAKKNQYKISYNDIKNADITIPANAKSIPLSGSVDFCNISINITNCQKNQFLFSLEQKTQKIDVDARAIDSGDLRHISELAEGMFLLLTEDANPWAERIGYNTSAMRKEAQLIINGMAQSQVVMPYNNAESQPTCRFVVVSEDATDIKNITLNRTSESTFKTYLFDINNQYNINLSNIEINTPANDLYGDAAIRVRNSVQVKMTDIRINGTYSQKRDYGYGITMDNITDYTAERIYGNGNWGIYGNNNINNALLIDCDINRWDTHCYGKDVTLRNCTFRDLYNQFSSVYGTIKFEGCHFINCIPYHLEQSYNSFVEHYVEFTDCTITSDKPNVVLFIYDEKYKEANKRQELSKKKMPHVTIKNMTIDISGQPARKIKSRRFSDLKAITKPII